MLGQASGRAVKKPAAENLGPGLAPPRQKAQKPAGPSGRDQGFFVELDKCKSQAWPDYRAVLLRPRPEIFWAGLPHAQLWSVAGGFAYLPCLLCTFDGVYAD